MISYRRLPPKLFDQWLDHCAKTFAKDESEVSRFRAYFSRHFLNDPWRDMSTIFVALENEKIIGTVRLFKRYVNFNDKKVTMGGIGEVSVVTEHQGKGIASNLLNLAYEDMVKENVNLSYLFGSRHLLYGRAGYQVLPLISYKIKPLSNIENKYTFEQHPGNENQTIRKIHSFYSGKINGPIGRNDFYWENWFKDEVNSYYQVFDEHDHLVAYIVPKFENETLTIKEYGSIEGINFIEVVSLLAKQYQPNTKIIHFQEMYATPEEFVERIEVKHLMVKLITPFDGVETNEQLIEKFKSTRTGYFSVDNF